MTKFTQITGTHWLVFLHDNHEFCPVCKMVQTLLCVHVCLNCVPIVFKFYMSVFTVNQANEDFHVSGFIPKKEVLSLSKKGMEIITEIFKIINDETNLPKCFLFVFYCIKIQKSASFFNVKALHFYHAFKVLYIASKQ